MRMKGIRKCLLLIIITFQIPYFYYLKKLVKRYPNITRFKKQLRIIYNNKKKFSLVKKMKNNNNKTF